DHAALLGRVQETGTQMREIARHKAVPRRGDWTDGRGVPAGHGQGRREGFLGGGGTGWHGSRSVPGVLVKRAPNSPRVPRRVSSVHENCLTFARPFLIPEKGLNVRRRLPYGEASPVRGGTGIVRTRRVQMSAHDPDLGPSDGDAASQVARLTRVLD